MSEPNPIRPLVKRDARAVAELHRRGIDSGFLSTLGAGFLRQMYKAITMAPAGFGYVWEQDGQVLGFVAGAERTGKLYKQALLRRGLLMGLAAMGSILRPARLRRIIETLRYPAETEQDLPGAEVLSIAVSEQARGKGVGKALMKTALEEFRRRGIEKLKVAVWADNEPANQFYKQCGFRLAQTRKHHGLAMNLYVIELVPEIDSADTGDAV